MSGIVPGALPLALAGEALWLLPQRALWWPARGVLAVADLHIGKAASFRALGLPVPAGTTGQNLDALDDLLRLTAARRLLFLGDLLHARNGRTSSLVARLRAWRARHAKLEMQLVRGNHDRHAGDPPPELEINVVDEPLREGPFLFCHHPHAGHAEHIVVAGHLHPVFGLAHRHERLRLPCFLLRRACLVLPAFGAFTGGYAIEQEAGDRIYLVTPEAVQPLPPLADKARNKERP